MISELQDLFIPEQTLAPTEACKCFLNESTVSLINDSLAMGKALAEDWTRVWMVVLMEMPT